MGKLLCRTKARIDDVIVVSESSASNRGDSEELEKGLEGLDMFGETIYHSRPFDGICGDCIRDSDFLEEILALISRKDILKRNSRYLS